MTEIIDRERAVELLRKQVEAKGTDYEYEAPASIGRCVYFDNDGCPSCVVGYVLADLGVTLGGVHEIGRDPGSPSDSGNQIAISAVNVDGVQLTSGARHVLATAQRAQDNGQPWGEALNLAVAAAASLRAEGTL